MTWTIFASTILKKTVIYYIVEHIQNCYTSCAVISTPQLFARPFPPLYRLVHIVTLAHDVIITNYQSLHAPARHSIPART